MVFQNLAKIEMKWNQTRLFGRHLFIYFFFFAELWFFMSRTYMVQISLQNSSGKVVFSGGGGGGDGSKSTLITKSVKLNSY